MRPAKKELVETDVETGGVGHDEMHGRLKMGEVADGDLLQAKVREFMLDELRGVCLNSLAEFGEANPTELQCLNDDDAGLFENVMSNDDADPQYKSFLDSLREIGNSFLIEYNVADGIKSCVRYEGEDGVYDRPESRVTKNEKNGVVRDIKIRRTSCASKRLKMENGKKDCVSKARVTQGENMKNRVVRDIGIQRISCASKRLKMENGRKDCIPKARVTDGEQKKNRVVSNTEIQRNSCASQRLKTENGRKDCVLKARVTDGLCTSRAASMVKNKRLQQSKGDVLQQGQKTKVANKDVELKAEKFVSCQRNSRLDGQPSLEVDVVSCQRNFSPGRQPSPEVEVVSGQRNFSSGGQPSPEVINSRAHENNAGKNLDVEDESYKLFLRWMLDAEENSRINLETGVLVKYETDRGSMSDSDVIEVGDHPFSDGEYAPFVPSKSYRVIDVDEMDCGGVANCSSWFRQKLMDILRKPFNETEFHELSSEVSVEKPVIRHVQLRNGREFSFPSKVLAGSYLTMYPDFKKVYYPWRKDHRRALNLLRGFFFYVEHVVHEDIFKPWLDAECLKAMRVK